MIRPSPELEAITLRWMDGLVAARGEQITALFSDHPGLLYCGTAQNEVWQDDLLRQRYPDHVSEIPASRYFNETVEAYDNGETGWSFWEGDVTWFETGRVGHFRISLVFVLEGAIWKIVQAHLSNPVSNLETFGYEHRFMSELLQAAEEETRQIGLTGTATVMFTDIADSSALAEAIGDAGWSAAAERHLDRIGRTVEARDGTLVKSLGDGTMSAFSSARAALSAALDIQRDTVTDPSEPVLRIRIGLHTGDVIRTEGDFFGTVVNKAARITAAAAPGEIRLSDACRAMVGDSGFTFSDAATVTLRGLDGTHLIHRLEWQP